MGHEEQEAAEMKTELQNRIEKLNAENREMGKKLDQMQEQYKEEKSEFQEQINNMESDLEEARGDIQELESALRSVYYLAGTESGLKQEGKIEGSFLGICGKRIGDVVSTDFTKSLNLNQSERIILNAEDYGISRISSVGILPQHFQKGQDYRIEYADGGRTAELILMGMEKYRMARLVIFLK